MVRYVDPRLTLYSFLPLPFLVLVMKMCIRDSVFLFMATTPMAAPRVTSIAPIMGSIPNKKPRPIPPNAVDVYKRQVLADDETHGRSIIYYPGTNRPLEISDLDKDYIQSASYLHLATDSPVAKQAAIWAREKGRTVVYLSLIHI